MTTTVRNFARGARTRSARSAVTAPAKPLVRWALGHRLPQTVLHRAARKGDLQGQLIEAGRGGDPFPVLERIRAADPILYRGQFSLVTTSLPVAREVLSSTDFRAGFDPSQLGGKLSRAFAWAADTGFVGPLQPPSLLVTEPPDHTRYRKLVTRVFTVKAVDRLRERTQQIALELLDGLADRDDVDLVPSYCTLLPVTVIAEILGVPVAERDRVLAFGEAAAPSLDIGLSWSRFRAVERALTAFDAWLGTHLNELRAHPGDDLLSQLVAAREDGVGLDERELKATAGLVLAAGFETTVNLLGNGIALLRRYPDQLDRLTAEPARWHNAIEEILRYDPPVLLTSRSAVRDTTIADRPIRAGTMITTALAAANRDPDVFDEPARFDIARPNAKDHLAFSAGRHFCLGAALARMEGEVGLRTLFERYPDLRTRPGARRRETRVLRGYAQLPARLGPRAPLPTR